jgi:hypothetical protein
MPVHLRRDIAPVTASVVIVGIDMVLAARPATPIQLAHACLSLGFDAVVPASWGDELVAADCVRRMERRAGGPAIYCACGLVAGRLLGGGPDLAPFIESFVSPPVAAARYLRALMPGRAMRLTYLGGCPAAIDPSIDVRMRPAEFLGLMFERGMLLAEQPKVFDSVIPPDRRRWCSLPGGLPHPEALWRDGGGYSLAELPGDDLSAELAQRLMAQERELIDVAPGAGCLCCGARPDVEPARARELVMAYEPPRAPHAPVDFRASVDLTPPVWPDLGLATTTAPVPRLEPPPPRRHSGETELPGTGAARRPSPSGLSSISGEGAAYGSRRRSMAMRSISRRRRAPQPLARLADGRVLPRAYAALFGRAAQSASSKPWAMRPSLPSKSWVVL